MLATHAKTVQLQEDGNATQQHSPGSGFDPRCHETNTIKQPNRRHQDNAEMGAGSENCRQTDLAVLRTEPRISYTLGKYSQ